MIIRHLLSVIAIIFLYSCSDKKTARKSLPESNGALGSMIVVAKDDLWQTPLKDTIESLLSKPILGLPNPEALMNHTFIALKHFKKHMAKTRNVLILDVNDSITKSINFIDNTFAKNQRIVTLKGRNSKELIKGIERYRDSIFSYYQEGDIALLQNYNSKESKRFSELDSKKIDLIISRKYRVIKNTASMVWLQRAIENGHINLAVYTAPFKEVTQLNIADIISSRDSISKIHFPGPKPGMHMVVEKEFEVFKSTTSIANMNALEVRGLWKVKGFLMGGPFVSYMIQDNKNKRTISIDGFIDAPFKSKKKYIMEIESIVKSLKP